MDTYSTFDNNHINLTAYYRMALGCNRSYFTTPKIHNRILFYNPHKKCTTLVYLPGQFLCRYHSASDS